MTSLRQGVEKENIAANIHERYSRQILFRGVGMEGQRGKQGREGLPGPPGKYFIEFVLSNFE